jgi:triphosphoribosyl-dephospho-CoA synthase
MTLPPGPLATIACVLEASARKPGNVHRFRDFEDSHYLDYLLSASAITPAMDRARTAGVGAAVLEAIEATRRVVSTNTNLGMVLLLAPLAAVAVEETDLAGGVDRVLHATTLDDARRVYQAIRLARPGGLGTAAQQDIAAEPTVTLTQAMRLAADRDLVARQYANSYTDVFKTGVPPLRAALALGQPLETAIIGTFLHLLASLHDSLIARKRGPAEARHASHMAAEILASGWPESRLGRILIDTFDAWLRAEGHARNPGAVADLTCASLFVALRDGTIELPRPAGPVGWAGEWSVVRSP